MNKGDVWEVNDRKPSLIARLHDPYFGKSAVRLGRTRHFDRQKLVLWNELTQSSKNEQPVTWNAWITYIWIFVYASVRCFACFLVCLFVCLSVCIFLSLVFPVLSTAAFPDSGANLFTPNKPQSPISQRGNQLATSQPVGKSIKYQSNKASVSQSFNWSITKTNKETKTNRKQSANTRMSVKWAKWTSHSLTRLHIAWACNKQTIEQRKNKQMDM